MASMPLSLFTRPPRRADAPRKTTMPQDLRVYYGLAPAVLAEDGEPALAGQPLERGLHHRTHVGVDLVDVRVLAEAGGDVDRLEHLGDDLGRQRQVWRED